MRVVLDTSVLVAAARSRQGASNALLLRLPDSGFVPAISVPLFVEYEAVLLRSENLLNRDPATVALFLDFLLSVSHLQEVFFAWRPALPDPDDDFILELAVAAGCRYIVTHNVRDFSGSEKWGITAVTPSDFLKLIESQT
jgi:putative PIN family toxin of toxin-antitoxin system